MGVRIIFDLVMQIRNGFAPLGFVFMAVSALIAAACLLFVFAGQRSRARHMLFCAAVGGASLGIFGFIGGFVGPIIFTPDANQGPLLGIFITGPLGFIVGFIGGLLVGALTAPVVQPPPLPPHHSR